MKTQAYMLFNRETGEMVPPIESTGNPAGMIFERLADAKVSAEHHQSDYDVTCDIRVCTIEVHGN